MRTNGGDTEMFMGNAFDQTCGVVPAVVYEFNINTGLYYMGQYQDAIAHMGLAGHNASVSLMAWVD